ncbi:inter-alpha-trypsin inhibitor heavy chain H3-like isoform X2 [Lycorma delicatula]|uniref:inter-alpha-trypsin inhibitor heavy chain H3-like isoform X2 n=1 Tax=Lycorma delicatula TaxID=130591 RepID=UPI003F51732B
MNCALVLVLFLSPYVFAEGETTTATDKKPKDTILKPRIKYIEYNSDIQHHYAKTVVSSNVGNPANESQEVHFSLVLPESAFISGFVMIIKDKEYEAYVKEKEKAKQIYNEAVAAGQSAAHIEQSVRDSNRFQVSVNVEARGKVTFKLTYEELLIRTLGNYVHTLNVNPGQIVKNLTVRVKIEEPVAITKVKVPNFRTKNEVVENEEEDNPTVKIERDPETPNKAVIIWSPTKEEQISIAEEGLQGQFVVEYDVDRAKSSQILLDEGYFVHFFTPDSSAPSLSKHVIFILDISGSMHGRKIEQLKEAMIKILNDLHENDYFSIILFASDVIIWSPIKTQYLFKLRHRAYDFSDKEISSIIENRTGNEIVLANVDNVNNAKEFIGKLHSTSATNIIGGLREGIKIANEGQSKFIASGSDRSKIPQPIIVFLTDGEPNVDVTNPNEIVNITSSLNEIKTPIYSLAFGDGADLQFLRRLSLRNYGFARNIYEAADAKLQLRNFYKEISSPLMADVKFSYLPGQVENGTLTTRHFPILFNGSEIVIAGKLSDSIPVHNSLTYELNSAKTVDNIDYNMMQRYIIVTLHHHEEANRTFGHLEKLWAYLTIKQLLDKDASLNEDNSINRNYGFVYQPPAEDKDEKEAKTISDEKKEALRLALKYSFVTPLTSLVVVKPNETSSAVDPKKASSSTSSPSYSKLGPASGIGASGAGAAFSAGFPLPPLLVPRPMEPPLSGYPLIAASPSIKKKKPSYNINTNLHMESIGGTGNERKTVDIGNNRKISRIGGNMRHTSNIGNMRRTSNMEYSNIGNIGNFGNMRTVGKMGNAGAGHYFSFGNIGNSRTISSDVPRTSFSSSRNYPLSGVLDDEDDSISPSGGDRVDSIVHSTAAPEPPPTSHKPDVHTVSLDTLSWLNKVNENSPLFIDIPNHGNYTVGFNQTDISSSSCQLPNKSEQGHCRHLQYCALTSFVTSIEEYMPYFCGIPGGFAGVCCPFLPPTH